MEKKRSLQEKLPQRSHQMDDENMNHKTRRKYVRDMLRSQTVILTDHLGRQHKTNELKRMMTAERYDFSIWFARVQRAQEAGREIHNKNLEMMYEQELNDEEMRQDRRLDFYKDLYGKKEGKRLHEIELERVAERFIK